MVKRKKTKIETKWRRAASNSADFFLFLAFYLFIYFSRDIDPLCFRRLRPIRDAEDAGRGFSFFFFSFLFFSFPAELLCWFGFTYFFHFFILLLLPVPFLPVLFFFFWGGGC